MHLIFLLARVYPYWALAVAILMLQVAIFYRRRKDKLQWTFVGVAGCLMLGILAWFIFRGDLYSDNWVRFVTGT
jgi:hypothetical protein